MTAYEIVSGDPALRHLLEQALQAVHAPEGSILLLSDDGQGLLFTLCCSPAAQNLSNLQQPLRKGITGLAVSLQQPMIVNDPGKNSAFDPTVDAAAGTVTKSIMVVPLATPEAEFGALAAINSQEPGGFNSENLERFSDFAEQISARLTELDLGMGDGGAL